MNRIDDDQHYTHCNYDLVASDALIQVLRIRVLDAVDDVRVLWCSCVATTRLPLDEGVHNLSLCQTTLATLHLPSLATYSNAVCMAAKWVHSFAMTRIEAYDMCPTFDYVFASCELGA